MQEQGAGITSDEDVFGSTLHTLDHVAGDFLHSVIYRPAHTLLLFEHDEPYDQASRVQYRAGWFQLLATQA